MGKILGAVVAIVLVIVVLCGAISGCRYVEPGYVGIKVNLYGDQKGVEDYPMETGRVMVNPFTQELYEYPTFMQNAVWTASLHEGSDVDQSISFNSSEGATISVDISLNYTVDAEKVPHLFVKHRQELDIISDTYLRNQVRDVFNDVGGEFKAVDIFGVRKQEMVDEINSILKEKLEPDGFLIDNVAIIGSPRADGRVMSSINSVIEATQRAAEAQNKVAQVKAEAEQKIEEANGEATAVLTVAKARAEANKVISESLTPELVKYEMLQKWDGVAPRVLGGESDILLGVSTE